jgi:hypothetical protein
LTGEEDDMESEDRKRGQRASFDQRTGEVQGSGSGAGAGAPGEDYDDDPMAGGGAEPLESGRGGGSRGGAS